MAKVAFDPAISGIRGKLGRLIYREQHGQTVVLGQYERKDRPTAAQRRGRERFREALTYAKGVLADPLKREHYRRLAAGRKQPVNSLLIANFLNPPTIEQVDLAAYRGKVDSVIRVVALDAIEVVAVRVTARDLAGTALETGPAESDHGIWTYRCTTALAGKATKLEITAANRAGAQAGSTVAL